MTATFDGPNLTVQIPSTGTFSAGSDLYSAWKQWVKQSDNAKYPQAFDTTGGDATSPGQKIEPYYFVRNDLGWRVRMPEQSGDVSIVGNLFRRQANLPLFVEASGFTAFLQLEVSNKATVVEVPGSGLTPAEAADLSLVRKHVTNTKLTDAQSGQMQLLDDDNQTPVLTWDIWEDSDGTIPYQRRGVERRDKAT